MPVSRKHFNLVDTGTKRAPKKLPPQTPERGGILQNGLYQLQPGDSWGGFRSQDQWQAMDVPADRKPAEEWQVALILSARKTNTRWREIAELVGLSAEQCREIYGEVTA